MTEAQLGMLPLLVQTYLRRAEVVGKPQVRNVRSTFRGQIRAKVDGPWMPFTARQHDFFDRPARLFLLDAKRAGIPFQAFHFYADGVATMEVKLASLFKVVDARGPEMNHSETVTFFNDMCLLAPSTLIDPSIVWGSIDATRVKATFSRSGQTVSAVLLFDEAGDLVNFQSDDRMQTEDGKTYRGFRWSTPVTGHRDFHGVRLAERGDASWAMPEGELVYARLEFVDVEADPLPETARTSR